MARTKRSASKKALTKTTPPVALRARKRAPREVAIRVSGTDAAYCPCRRHDSVFAREVGTCALCGHIYTGRQPNKLLYDSPPERWILERRVSVIAAMGATREQLAEARRAIDAEATAPIMMLTPGTPEQEREWASVVKSPMASASQRALKSRPRAPKSIAEVKTTASDVERFALASPMVNFRGPDGRPFDPYAAPAVDKNAEELRRIKEEPRVIGTVIEIRGERMSLSLGFPPAVDVRSIGGAEVGDRVLLNRNTMAPLEVVKDKVPTGTVLMVERVTGEMVECDKQGTMMAFRCPSLKVRKGERVIIDACNTNVIGSLGMPPPSFLFAPRVDVSWDDIGGQEEAKEALREALELPFAQPALFKAYGKKHCKGVLLSGSAGCGKTILAKAAATANGRAHGKSGGAFIYVKGPELLNKWVGNSEAAVRAVFQAAREHKLQHGDQALIFIDEADALLGARDNGMSTGMNATGVVQQFLAEMDGFDEQAAIMILATNRPDMIDAAVTRDGRIDRKVRVTRPTREDAAKIFAIHLKNKPMTGDEHIERAVAELFSDSRIVRDLGDRIYVRLRDMVSGAMIAGIVEQASTAAIRRDMAAKAKKASGITVDDLVFAVDRAQRGVRDTNHGEVVKELIEAAHEMQIAALANPLSTQPSE